MLEDAFRIAAHPLLTYFEIPDNNYDRKGTKCAVCNIIILSSSRVLKMVMDAALCRHLYIIKNVHLLLLSVHSPGIQVITYR